MPQFNIADAKSHFSELVQKALTGEDVVIARDNRPILRLVPVKSASKGRHPGSAKGKILYIAPDFDEPLADFAEYR
ncbi:MAG: type II toxin-antitoxin system prevent-host-death family antitoxin [Deltaproteobacteria bacterium HGW-Deltaproteobacteria-23]|nr:MAG: type II toxin-antitoxin system prevent-host-death family antitoxin [Deltaproteobacteria bacterium HGW-Deltaproteobacteria-23]